MTYFISDIHGEYELFMRLLDKIKFSFSDTLFVLGDMIDKGSDSVRVLKYVYNKPNVFCVLGNHEYDFLKYYRALMEKTRNDFDKVLEKFQAYFPYDDSSLTWEILDWLDSLPHYVQAKEYIGVHAGVPLDGNGKIKPLSEGDIEQFVYDRNFKNPDTVVNDDRTVLYGHTPTKYLNGTGKIIKYPRLYGTGYSRIHLDTGVYLTGTLGCYRFETGECIYSVKSHRKK